MSRATTWLSYRRFPDFGARIAHMGRITAVFASYGIADYSRASTRISARHADVEETKLLGLAPGAILLASEAIDVDDEGNPVSYALSRFPAERVGTGGLAGNQTLSTNPAASVSRWTNCAPAMSSAPELSMATVLAGSLSATRRSSRLRIESGVSPATTRQPPLDNVALGGHQHHQRLRIGLQQRRDNPA